MTFISGSKLGDRFQIGIRKFGAKNIERDRTQMQNKSLQLPYEQGVTQKSEHMGLGVR